MNILVPSRKHISILVTWCLALSLGACASILGLQSNHGDEISARLTLGLTKQEVESHLDDMKYLMLSKEQFKLPWGYLYFGAGTEATPADLLLTLPEGTETWDYAYWVSSNDQRGVRVFFSNEGRVIGWVRVLSEKSEQKYLHEKLTNELKRGMTDAQVVAVLGQPQAFVPRPTYKEKTRELYADHYWESDPVYGIRPQMWLYSYKLPDGGKRQVYLLWEKTLSGWGYDNAHEEAELKNSK